MAIMPAPPCSVMGEGGGSPDCSQGVKDEIFIVSSAVPQEECAKMSRLLTRGSAWSAPFPDAHLLGHVSREMQMFLTILISTLIRGRSAGCRVHGWMAQYCDFYSGRELLPDV